MTARAGAPPGKRTGPRGQGAGTVEQGRANGLTVTLADTRDMADRPRCDVVGVYCEALWWLRREPRCHATACCRHFWGDDEAGGHDG